MADSFAEDGQPFEVCLENGPVAVYFTNQALLTSSHINFYKGDRVVLHVKYVPLRGGFVLNDRQGEEWGQQLFVECLRVPGDAGLRITLSYDLSSGAVIALPGDAVPLADRFDLAGSIIGVAPPVISLKVGTADEGEATDVLGIARIRSAEDSGIEMGLDATLVSASAFTIEGWVDDRRSRLVGITMVDYATGARVQLPFGRSRRPDVDQHLRASRPGEFGFWCVGLGGPEQLDTAALSLVFEDSSGVPLTPGPRVRLGGAEFFELLLANFGRRNVIGNVHARSFSDFDAGFGEFLEKLYRQIRAQRRVVTRASFGPAEDEPAVSLICVLYGVPDFLYLLVSQFAKYGTLAGLEFVFVSNSPELDEVLLRDAELASIVFGATIRLLTLNQNSGFSHANNVGVAAARAKTVAIINPDVFPRSAAAVARLRAIAADPPANDIVGGKLYYADGSVMHEGMYFEKEQKLSVVCKVPVWTVEHFRKGFADTAPTTVREVPAISGALMVLTKELFERVNGFNTHIIFGHYEDADLCLKIKRAGGRVLVDPELAYWHYEGMGSVKKPEHYGSGMYNRWYFARTWGRRLADVLVEAPAAEAVSA